MRKGFRATGISIVSDTKIDHLGRWPVSYIRGRTRGTTLGRGGAGESGFDPAELWVMGPPCGLKVGRAKTSCVIMQARDVRGYPVSYVGNNSDTKGEGRREPFPAR